MTKTTGPPSRARKPTSEQRARDNRRKRLKETGARIDAFAEALELELTDRSGNAHWRHRLFGGLLCESHVRKRSLSAPSLPEQVARIQKDAAEGCGISEQWLSHYGPIYALCIDLQHEQPPERAADYDPLECLSPAQRTQVQLRIERKPQSLEVFDELGPHFDD